MEGKPFAVIETDGHAGDAGTKTRVEAFLHCIRELGRGAGERPPRPSEQLTVQPLSILEIAASGERVLVPSLGPAADVLGAAIRGMGVPAEVLPDPDVAALRAGRRHTSGQECLPMTLTLGSLLLRLEAARGTDERFAFVMPGTSGPCRFGAYKELHQLVLDRLGWRPRVRIWSPPFGDYFRGLPPGFGALVLAGAFASDALGDLLRDVRPREVRPGAANAIHARWHAALVERIERAARGDVSASRLLREAATGRLYGLPALVARAASEFRAAGRPVDLPRVLVVGEIYVRNVPFANGGAVEALERRGLATRVAGVGEFLQYSEWCGSRQRRLTLGDRLDGWVRHRIEATVLGAAADAMGWPRPVEIGEVVHAARPYVRDALEGETVLTVGAALHAWRRHRVDAVLVVGPLECMPNKVAESQLVHAGEREALPSLTLSLNGDPIDFEPLDGFAVGVHDRVRAQGAFEPGEREPSHVRRSPERPGPAPLRSLREARRQTDLGSTQPEAIRRDLVARIPRGTCPGCTWWARR
jgi:predicted nucleotide-binding protein (sugar kinase/HSP70/actin superfamily)